MSQNSQPITWTVARPDLRVIWHIAAVLVAAVALQLPLAASADAGPRRARLSSDLSAHLDSGSSGDVDVIVSGSVEKIERLAQRHGLRIKKQLSRARCSRCRGRRSRRCRRTRSRGAVGQRAWCVRTSALTTDVTGADAAWAGAIASLGEVNGSGIGVAVIDSGIAADHPALQNRVIASVDFTDRQRQGPRLLRPRHAHRRHHRGAQLQQRRSTAPIRAWRRPRT